MFYIYQRQKDIADYGSDKKMRFDSVLKIFQEAAVNHSASVGYPADTYMGQGSIWILNRIMFHVRRFPDFSDDITVKTWSRGLDKFKGYRNYEISSGGETLIEGSGIWLYIDIAKKRPVRVTQEMFERYDSENVCNMNRIIDEWDTKGADGYVSEDIVPLRPADFDINGHMNNIRYGEIISSVSQDIDFTGKTVGLFYSHEITPDTKYVTVKHAETAKSKIISIFTKETLSCLCEIF